MIGENFACPLEAMELGVQIYREPGLAGEACL
jgi:hypothetical protein